MLVDPHKGLLRQVVGVILVAQHSAEELKDGLRVSGHQVVERGVVPAR
jgi:hypothetical protein